MLTRRLLPPPILPEAAYLVWYPVQQPPVLEKARLGIKHELDQAARNLAADLRPSHVRLISITPDGGLRLGDLASKAGMTAQSLGEFVDTLNRAGYMEVIPDPAGRRARLVRPTHRGVQVAMAMNATVHELETRWFEQFSDRQWQDFRRVLTTLGG